MGGDCGQFRREFITVHKSYVRLSLEWRSLHPERYAFTRLFRRSIFIEAEALTILETDRVHFQRNGELSHETLNRKLEDASRLNSSFP